MSPTNESNIAPMHLTEAIELPDYVPTELTPLEKATLENQNKEYKMEVSVERPRNKSTVLSEKSTYIAYVLKDNELYLGKSHPIKTVKDTGSHTVHLRDAQIWKEKEQAESFFKMLKDIQHPILDTFLTPEIQKILVGSWHTTTYEEID